MLEQESLNSAVTNSKDLRCGLACGMETKRFPKEYSWQVVICRAVKKPAFWCPRDGFINNNQIPIRVVKKWYLSIELMLECLYENFFVQIPYVLSLAVQILVLSSFPFRFFWVPWSNAGNRAPNMRWVHQNSHLSCLRPCSRIRSWSCRWMASPYISFGVLVGFCDRASFQLLSPQAAFSLVCNSRQWTILPPVKSFPCATWLILNTRLCLQGERVEWGRSPTLWCPQLKCVLGLLPWKKIV